MKVTVFSTSEYEKDFLKEASKGKHELIFLQEPLSPATAALAQGSDAISVFVNDNAGSEVLSLLNRLDIKYIATRAAGYDNIDLKTAKELGIKAANVPSYSPNSIAEHTIALIMTLNRKIIQANHHVKNYNFKLDELVGFDMNGKTAGIVGLGKIGGIVAKILHGFGCKLLAYDVEVNEEYVKNYGIKYVTLEELCASSDIITLHAPLNVHTRHLINKNLLSKMKNSVMLINTGRGPLINTEDVIEALKSGKVGYLGLDVYEFEKGLFFHDRSKNIPEDKLFAQLQSFENVLITGHQAFLTSTALKNIADTTFYNLDCWAEKQASENEL